MLRDHAAVLGQPSPAGDRYCAGSMCEQVAVVFDEQTRVQNYTTSSVELRNNDNVLRQRVAIIADRLVTWRRGMARRTHRLALIVLLGECSCSAGVL